ncbi:hypothetical protein B296_00018882 [Ensete ventricosum]|uniref:Uncharacterized protein n=1 Tax=Ensete ventricosum TaxID=4639 RepID=A0A426ZMQ8_ENSVE|nr:hypothetical protein B296_00018882 [Ensete ventricosum]
MPVVVVDLSSYKVRRCVCWGHGCNTKAATASPALEAATAARGRRALATTLLSSASPPSSELIIEADNDDRCCHEHPLWDCWCSSKDGTYVVAYASAGGGRRCDYRCHFHDHQTFQWFRLLMSLAFFYEESKREREVAEKIKRSYQVQMRSPVAFRVSLAEKEQMILLEPSLKIRLDRTIMPPQDRYVVNHWHLDGRKRRSDDYSRRSRRCSVSVALRKKMLTTLKEKVRSCRWTTEWRTDRAGVNYHGRSHNAAEQRQWIKGSRRARRRGERCRGDALRIILFLSFPSFFFTIAAENYSKVTRNERALVESGCDDKWGDDSSWEWLLQWRTQLGATGVWWKKKSQEAKNAAVGEEEEAAVRHRTGNGCDNNKRALLGREGVVGQRSDPVTIE